MLLWAKLSMRALPTMRKQQATLTPHSFLVRQTLFSICVFSFFPTTYFFPFVFLLSPLFPQNKIGSLSRLRIKSMSELLKCKQVGAVESNIWFDTDYLGKE